MNGNKVVISFDPDTYISSTESMRIWAYNEFRELIKELAKKTDNLDLWLITTSTDTSYINKVVSQINAGNQDTTLLISAHVLTVASGVLKEAAITQYNVDLHFDGYNVSCESIERNTTSKGILVDFKRTNEAESLWLSRFQFEYSQLVKPGTATVLE